MPKYSKKNLKKNKNKNRTKLRKKKSKQWKDWLNAANNYRKVASKDENKLLSQVNKIVKLYA
jgi:hypothetical protein